MTGEKGGLLAGLRAEALKSRHAAPVRLAVLMALPMPLLGAMPYRGVQIFSAWNYWYALFLPVSLSLVVACVARADARTRMRGLLGLGFPLRRAWWAKALWCLALCALSNLVVFGIYLGLATLMWTVPGGAQETGGPYMRDPRHPRHFTDEFKRQIVDLYNAGKPKREIMDEYDLGKSTVERWIKSINATGSPRAACNRTPEQNRILELERENRRLRMEVDVLKQAALIYARK